MYIEKINGPAGVERLPAGELETLSGEVRSVLLKKLSEHGGHAGPNLGMVEATIALHCVFNSLIDKIAYDVSHQSYAHKMLAGRKALFMNVDGYDEVSDYSKPSESEHDFFVIGHISTSVSLACGLTKARDLKGDTGNVIAVIGGGSLSGGEAFEELNSAAELDTNFIVIVNDNRMSIAENHGGLYRNLQLLREADGQAPHNFFRATSLDYLYVKGGNDARALVDAFQSVKDIDHPIVVHINTLKGKGFKFAEQQQEYFHYSTPFSLEADELSADLGNAEDYTGLTVGYLLHEMQKDRTLVGTTAGTPAVFGFTAERRKRADKQFVGTDIAEEHAVAMASSIAVRGGKPVFGVYSTFVQRAYDQLSQDLCINNSAVLLLVFWGGSGSMDDVTHLCLFDIPLISNIPNMVYLAPTCREEYFVTLEWGIRQKDHLVAIRVPVNEVIIHDIEPAKDYGELNRYGISHLSEKVAVLGLDSYYQLGKEVVRLLKQEKGIGATLIDPRFITGSDEALLDDLKKRHTLVVTLEDGVLDGGFGERIARYYGPSEMKVLNYGVRKEFIDRFDVSEQLLKNRLTALQIVEDICACTSFVG